jgi:hypothetical protein
MPKRYVSRFSLLSPTLSVPQWEVQELGNGEYTIRNVRYDQYANHDFRPKADSHVYGTNEFRQWCIKESIRSNYYM